MQDDASGTGLTWPAVEEAVAYDAVRGNTANLHDAGESIDPGPVACSDVDRAVRAFYPGVMRAGLETSGRS
ncbi:MAG TPA: hypothetical protein VFQ07_06390 [Candidatus Polarisedimenticolia bacterium]|nr:hypothetical protein [Candidatus Polarisedimenticolia bacterium]